MKSAIILMVILSSGKLAFAAPVEVKNVQAVIDSVKRADYLPLRYVYEATFLYHYVMAMEISAQTDATLYTQYIHTDADVVKPNLGDPEFYGWRYHAGLLMWPESSPEPYIFDVISSREPVLRSSWVKILFPEGSQGLIKIHFADAANLSLNNYILENFAGPKTRDRLNFEPTVFNAGDAAEVCKLISEVIPYEPGLDPEQAEAKSKRFRQRMTELSLLLTEKGRMENLEYVGADLYGCGLESPL